MTIERVLDLVDKILCDRVSKPLSDLQAIIIREVWQGTKYAQIAERYGYTEGHIKDAAAALWQVISSSCNQKVSKRNFKRVISSYLATATQHTGLETPHATDTSFLGREQAISHLFSLLAQKNKLIAIQGQGGIGKTTLAKKFLTAQKFDLVLELLMAKETDNIVSVRSVIEEWLKRDFDEEPGREFGVSLDRLKRHLITRSVGILIDNFEPALDKQGQLISNQKDYLELLRILADDRINSVAIITTRHRLCEPDLALVHYRLPGLATETWQQFFEAHNITSTKETATKIHHTYGGNPKAMNIIAAVAKEDFARSLEAYWQENQTDPLGETNLKNLVATQFNRLQELDPFAHTLLCRVGCYRFQDVPTVTQEALLALLTDVAPSRRKAIIKSLRNRSLLQFSEGNYWLHPVIKAEALSRLSKEQWQQTHRQIAQFYTASISQIDSVQTGLVALEAYYHYYTIADFSAAGKVILYSRSNQWGQHLTLGTHLHRLGLSQPLLTAITQIVHRVAEAKIASELNNILGDLYWIQGKLKNAIACQEVTITAANNYLNKISLSPHNSRKVYYWKMLQVDSLLSIGLYNIDLWELNIAEEYLERVIAIASETKHHSWAEKAAIALALVHSYLGKMQPATATVQHFLDLIAKDSQIYNTGRFAYFLQLLGQTLVNLKQYNVAQDILSLAMAKSQESGYIQIEAKSTTSLGIIARQQQHLDKAITYHLQAISWLENIGAKCDLAEAYYQYALTLQQQNTPYQEYLNKAIALWQQIEAVKQIQRIQGSLS